MKAFTTIVLGIVLSFPTWAQQPATHDDECRVHFTVVRLDPALPDRRTIGMSDEQQTWWNKKGRKKKELRGLCYTGDREAADYFIILESSEIYRTRALMPDPTGQRAYHVLVRSEKAYAEVYETWPDDITKAIYTRERTSERGDANRLVLEDALKFIAKQNPPTPPQKPRRP